MSIIKWIKEGMPLGVPFVLRRDVCVDRREDLELAVDVAVRNLVLAVKEYQKMCGAKEVEYLEIEDHFGDLWPVEQYEHIYVALSVTSPGRLRVGAKVCMR